MSGSAMSYMASQLGYQTPAILVYLLAFIAALVFIQRALLPSVLTLFGAGVLLISTLAVAMIQGYLIQSRGEDGRSMESFSQIMSLVGIIGSCVRALGLSLLVVAIFVGRSQASSALRDFDASPAPVRK